VSSGSGRTTPDESVIVTVTPPDELPKPVHSWTSSMASSCPFLLSLVCFLPPLQ